MENLRLEKAVAAVCIVAVAATLKFHRESEPAEAPLPVAAGTAGMDELWRDAVGARSSLQRVPREDMVLEQGAPAPPAARRAAPPAPAPRRAPPRTGDDIYASPKAESAKVLSQRLKPKAFSFFEGGSKATTSAFLVVPKEPRRQPVAQAAAPPAQADPPGRRPWRSLSSRGASAGE